MSPDQMLFPNLSSLKKAVFYLHDGTYANRSLLGIGIEKQIKIQNPVPNTFELLDAFLKQAKWKMGYIGYDTKNATENLKSPLLDPQAKPCLFFVIPEMVFSIEKGEIQVLQGDNHPELKNIIQTIAKGYESKESPNIELTARINKHQYLHSIENIQNHIQKGDIYELNFCQEFYASNTTIDPFDVYYKLHQITKAPFSTFLKWDQHSLMCASPERFLSQNGNSLISQPIKGTIKRGKTDEEDKTLVEQLKNDPKE
ncbi:MAG: chorismate-binding protein, partial [Flavobacteriales bacterium]